MYLSFELECEKNENKRKEAGIGPFKKKQILNFNQPNKVLTIRPFTMLGLFWEESIGKKSFKVEAF